MSNEPGPPVVRTGPTLHYEQRDSGPLAEATKDLLMFMRVNGFTCEHLEVTDKGVLLGKLTDHYPSRPQAMRPQTPATPSPSYDHDFPNE